MAARVTPQEIVEMQRLYAELGTFCGSWQKNGTQRLHSSKICSVEEYAAYCAAYFQRSCERVRIWH